MDEVMQQAYEKAREKGWSGSRDMWAAAWQAALSQSAAAEDQELAVDARIADLAMLVKKLSLALRKAAPTHELPDQAVDYLRRKGIAGSPLRTAEYAVLISDSTELTPVQRAVRRLMKELAGEGSRRGQPALSSEVPARGMSPTWSAERIDEKSARLFAPDGESWVVSYADEADQLNHFVWQMACRLASGPEQQR